MFFFQSRAGPCGGPLPKAGFVRLKRSGPWRRTPGRPRPSGAYLVGQGHESVFPAAPARYLWVPTRTNENIWMKIEKPCHAWRPEGKPRNWRKSAGKHAETNLRPMAPWMAFSQHGFGSLFPGPRTNRWVKVPGPAGRPPRDYPQPRTPINFCRTPRICGDPNCRRNFPIQRGPPTGKPPSKIAWSAPQAAPPKAWFPPDFFPQ